VPRDVRLPSLYSRSHGARFPSSNRHPSACDLEDDRPLRLPRPTNRTLISCVGVQDRLLGIGYGLEGRRELAHLVPGKFVIIASTLGRPQCAASAGCLANQRLLVGRTHRQPPTQTSTGGTFLARRLPQAAPAATGRGKAAQCDNQRQLTPKVVISALGDASEHPLQKRSGGLAVARLLVGEANLAAESVGHLRSQRTQEELHPSRSPHVSRIVEVAIEVPTFPSTSYRDPISTHPCLRGKGTMPSRHDQDRRVRCPPGTQLQDDSLTIDDSHDKSGSADGCRKSLTCPRYPTDCPLYRTVTLTPPSYTSADPRPARPTSTALLRTTRTLLDQPDQPHERSALPGQRHILRNRCQGGTQQGPAKQDS